MSDSENETLMIICPSQYSMSVEHSRTEMNLSLTPLLQRHIRAQEPDHQTGDQMSLDTVWTLGCICIPGTVSVADERVAKHGYQIAQEENADGAWIVRQGECEERQAGCDVADANDGDERVECCYLSLGLGVDLR